jgi:pimeloyl-ACP methyl ester carboxylesterase
MVSPSISGKYVDVMGAPVYIETAGTGAEIVCLHTAGRDGRQWHRWMEYLSDTYTVIAPDFPGHGKSWPLPGQRLLDDPNEILDWIWAVCAAVGARRPILAGCSMGGNWVLGLAIQHPEIQAVIAMEGAAYTPTISAITLELLTHPQVNFIEFTRGQSIGLIGSRCENSARDLLTWQVIQGCAACQQADLTAYTQFDVRASIHSIRCPVLLLRGQEDWLVSQEMVEATAAALPSAEFSVIPGGGHYIHTELAGEVCEMVRDFLARRVRPG